MRKKSQARNGSLHQIARSAGYLTVEVSDPRYYGQMARFIVDCASEFKPATVRELVEAINAKYKPRQAVSYGTLQYYLSKMPYLKPNQVIYFELAMSGDELTKWENSNEG